MRVSAIQWSKLFIVVLPTHKYMYTSSTTTLQLCLLGPLGMHYQFSHFNNRGQWYSKVTNKIFTVLSSAVTNSGAVIKSGRQLIQSLRYIHSKRPSIMSFQTIIHSRQELAFLMQAETISLQKFYRPVRLSICNNCIMKASFGSINYKVQ